MRTPQRPRRSDMAIKEGAGQPAIAPCPRIVARGTITAADGVRLATRIIGPETAGLTVVLVHGYCLSQASWRPILDRLEQHYGTQLRLVTYDQRGHGRSSVPPPESCTVGQLGEDLQTVLDTVAPTGPVVTVGHSMGGMSILAHALRHPGEVGDRIVGTALLSTAAQGLAAAGVLPGINRPVLAAFRGLLRVTPSAADGIKARAVTAATPLLRYITYGRRPVAPGGAALSAKMIGSTPVETIGAFVRSLTDHDERDALPVLAQIPSVVVCGDADIATPLRNSIQLAGALRSHTMLRVPGAGHMAHFEQPDLVVSALVNLLDPLVALHRGPAETSALLT